MIVGQEMVAGFQQHLLDLARELGVDEHVVFTGRRSDVARLMAGADIFAMPSLGEPFGLVFLEAMAMTLPVVALDSGGASEVVEANVTGLLSDHGDTSSASSSRTCWRFCGIRPAGAAWVRRDEARGTLTHIFAASRMAADTSTVYKRLTSRGARTLDGLSERT